VRYREELEPDHDFDLIVLSVSHHRLAEATAFLAPRVGQATVLVFGNIWTEPRAAIGALPLDQIAWGFPQAGGGFGADGVLRGLLLPSVIFGTLGRPPTDRERAVRQAFREAGLRLKEQPDFRGWLWVHFVSDAGLFSQGLRLGSLSGLAGAHSEPDAEEPREVCRDTLAEARRLGISVPRLEAAEPSFAREGTT
jgi:2-dehydropantoate 2-reductase